MTMEVIRKTTLPIPRCPMCHAVLEEAQISWVKDGRGPFDKSRWEETWGCDSCHTMHTFPARLEFLEYVGITPMHTWLAQNGLLDFHELNQKLSRQLPMSPRTLYLPK